MIFSSAAYAKLQKEITFIQEHDSNRRIYYKVPSQLEKHYKKSVSWRVTRSTVMMGSSAAALEPLRELFAKPNNTTVLHARSLPDRCYSE